jgi:putative phosphoserine phosphatase / 1-acylglycerol-3-phosphate O-acyltransferase
LPDLPGGSVSNVPTLDAQDEEQALMDEWRDEAVFVDLDRTLLRGASGLVLSAAMHAQGLFEGRRSLPGEALFYAFYDRTGENIPFMAMVRAAPLFVRGWEVDAVRSAGELATEELTALVQPYAPGVLAEHRALGRRLVLATTTPVDLIAPFAEKVGFDDVVATRYASRDGRYVGSIDGPFVWGTGKLQALREWSKAHGVDMRRSHAYSDSFYDIPLLQSVGAPHAVNPDRRLHLTALARRWPIEHWDRPPGVPKIVGMEPYDIARNFIRPEFFPYARFDIEGIENVPSRGPAILASNHRSYFDVVALAIVASRIGRPVRFLAKKEIFDAPIIGQIARAIGGISVDRASDSAARSDEPLAAARRALEAGEPVVILPQGTIPRGRAFFDTKLRGKTGTARLAATTGAPVIPIGIWGTERVWPRSSRVPDITAVAHPPKVVVRVGKPVHIELRDAVDDTEAIMDAISALLPDEARRPHEPSEEEISRTMPPGTHES